MTAVADWLAKGQAYLEARGVEETRANAEFLLAAVLGLGRGGLYLRAGRPLMKNQGISFWNLVKKRGRRWPLAYVLGSQPFMGLDMEVAPGVLIPRPETEELVERALRLLASSGRGNPRVLEIGTGSGCVAVALARSLPRARVVATDISLVALDLALRNARRHRCAGRVCFMREDVRRPGPRLSAWADLVVSNPPYVPSGDIASLEPEVLREPRLALDGGRDGLSALRAVAARAWLSLKPGACLIVEIGAGQGRAAAGLFEESGYRDVAVERDVQGLERIVSGRRPS